jgi:hypothetical protein
MHAASMILVHVCIICVEGKAACALPNGYSFRLVVCVCVCLWRGGGPCITCHPLMCEVGGWPLHTFTLWEQQVPSFSSNIGEMGCSCIRGPWEGGGAKCITSFIARF